MSLNTYPDAGHAYKGVKTLYAKLVWASTVYVSASSELGPGIASVSNGTTGEIVITLDHTWRRLVGYTFHTALLTNHVASEDVAGAKTIQIDCYNSTPAKANPGDQTLYLELKLAAFDE